MAFMTLLLCLLMATRALVAPPEPQQEGEEKVTTSKRAVLSIDSGLVPYTEATPSNDFTLLNVSSTVEEILTEVGVLQDTETYR